MTNNENEHIEKLLKAMPIKNAPSDFTSGVMHRVYALKKVPAKPLISAWQWIVAAVVVLSIGFLAIAFIPSGNQFISISQYFTFDVISHGELFAFLGHLKIKVDVNYIYPMIGGTLAILFLILIENRMHRTT